MLIAYRAGLLTLCECGAGAAKLAWFVKTETTYEADDQQIERMRKESDARKSDKLFEDAGVPPKFLQYTWDSFGQVAGKDKGKELLISAVDAYFENGNVQTADGLTSWGIFAWASLTRARRVRCRNCSCTTCG